MNRMQRMETGLRLRVKRAVRQMSDQHRHIRAIHGSIRDALARGGASDAEAALDRLQSAMEAHFALEDEVFFPALHGLRPEFAEALETLSREHAEFAAGLRRMIADLQASGVEALQNGFEAYTRALVDHEGREEEIVTELVASLVSTS
jgi:iron-sulfur cluster repair protein YtfE (RIC family)